MNLRSDPSTLAARRPRPFAGTWKSKQPWSSHARWVRAPAPSHPGDDDRGCSSTRIEEGSVEPSGGTARLDNALAPRPTPFTRRCSAHAARIRKESGSFPPPRRASSHAPSSPRKRRRPREGDAERVDRRHGSSASLHGPHRPGSLLSRGAGATLLGSKRPAEGTRGGASSAKRSAQAGTPPGNPRAAGNRRRGERGQRRQPRAEEDSRLAGVPARRSCVAEIGSAVVVQRSRRHLPRS